MPPADHDAPSLHGFEKGLTTHETNDATCFPSLNAINSIGKTSEEFASTYPSRGFALAFEHERGTAFDVGEQGHEAGLVVRLSLNGYDGQLALTRRLFWAVASVSGRSRVRAALLTRAQLFDRAERFAKALHALADQHVNAADRQVRNVARW